MKGALALRHESAKYRLVRALYQISNSSAGSRTADASSATRSCRSDSAASSDGHDGGGAYGANVRGGDDACAANGDDRGAYADREPAPLGPLAWSHRSCLKAVPPVREPWLLLPRRRQPSSLREVCASYKPPDQRPLGAMIQETRRGASSLLRCANPSQGYPLRALCV